MVDCTKRIWNVMINNLQCDFIMWWLIVPTIMCNVSNLQRNISVCFVDFCKDNHLFLYFLYMVYRMKFLLV